MWKKTAVAVCVTSALLTGVLGYVANAHATEGQQLKTVRICNKIERFSLSIMSHIKDSMGETCFVTKIPAEDAVEGKVLSEESRWYQGSSINPTKSSVTRVAEVLE